MQTRLQSGNTLNRRVPVATPHGTALYRCPNLDTGEPIGKTMPMELLSLMLLSKYNQS